MQLTGKAEKDFEKYFLTEVMGYKEFMPLGYKTSINLFRSYKSAMRFGVYVDFFYSKGIYVEVDRLLVSDFSMEYARESAIEKANEIYNSK